MNTSKKTNNLQPPWLMRSGDQKLINKLEGPNGKFAARPPPSGHPLTYSTTQIQLAFPHSAAPMLITLMRRFLRSPVSGIFPKTQTRVCLLSEQYFLRPSNSVVYLEKPKHSLVVVLETGSTAAAPTPPLPLGLATGTCCSEELERCWCT